MQRQLRFLGSLLRTALFVSWDSIYFSKVWPWWWPPRSAVPAWWRWCSARPRASVLACWTACARAWCASSRGRDRGGAACCPCGACWGPRWRTAWPTTSWRLWCGGPPCSCFAPTGAGSGSSCCSCANGRACHPTPGVMLRSHTMRAPLSSKK